MKKLHLILLEILVFLMVGCSCGKPTYKVKLDQMFTVKIRGIQINNTIVESAEVGDKVGILLSSVEGLTKDDLARGDIVYVHIP